MYRLSFLSRLRDFSTFPTLKVFGWIFSYILFSVSLWKSRLRPTVMMLERIVKRENDWMMVGTWSRIFIEPDSSSVNSDWL